MQGVTQSTKTRADGRFLVSPKWIAFHLIVLIGIVGMVNLGFWQLRRLDQRRAFNATVTERIDQAPVPLDSLLPTESVTSTDADEIDGRLADLEWRPVVVSGTFVPDADVEVVNKSHDGRPGSHTVTPLRLDDGRLVLVNRGFVALTATPPPAPDGPVVLTGLLRQSQQREGLGLRDPDTGPLSSAQRVDIARLAPQFDRPLVPMYVEVTDRFPNDQVSDDVVPLRLPALTEGNHLSYAGQWFIFSVAVAVGWVLAVRRSWRKHNPAE